MTRLVYELTTADGSITEYTSYPAAKEALALFGGNLETKYIPIPEENHIFQFKNYVKPVAKKRG